MLNRVSSEVLEDRTRHDAEPLTQGIFSSISCVFSPPCISTCSPLLAGSPYFFWTAPSSFCCSSESGGGIEGSWTPGSKGAPGGRGGSPTPGGPKGGPPAPGGM